MFALRTPPTRSPAAAAPPVSIELFALDTEHCSPCRAAARDLEEAAVQLIRAAPQASITTRVVVLTDAADARRRGVVGSPTVRVDGEDVSLAVDEQACPTCTELAAAPVACRTYDWRGERFDHPPAGLVVDAVLRHLDGDSRGGAGRSTRPDGDRSRPGDTSVDRFFAARAASAARTSPAHPALSPGR